MMEKSEKIAKLRDIENRIICFYSLRNPELEKYYSTDYNGNQKDESYHDIIVGHLDPIECREFKNSLEQQGINFQITYPLNGEVAFVTAKRKAR